VSICKLIAAACICLMPAIAALANEADTNSTTHQASAIDTTAQPLLVIDTLALDSAHHKHTDFNYRRQVGVGLGMMAFLAFIVTATQTWNPR